jgi:translation initiation factor IF-2
VARGRRARLGVYERAEGVESHAKTLCTPREHARAQGCADASRTGRAHAGAALRRGTTTARAEAAPGRGRAAQGPRHARAGARPRHLAMATPGPSQAGQEAALHRGRGGLGEAAPGRGATATPGPRREHAEVARAGLRREGLGRGWARRARRRGGPRRGVRAEASAPGPGGMPWPNAPRPRAPGAGRQGRASAGKREGVTLGRGRGWGATPGGERRAADEATRAHAVSRGPCRGRRPSRTAREGGGQGHEGGDWAGHVS